MDFKSVGSLYDALKGAVKEVKEGAVEVLDEKLVRGAVIDKLVYNAVFSSNEEVRDVSRRLIKYIGLSLGIRSASIQGLYEAMGRGECGGFTVPAINIRGLTYDTARAIFRSAQRNNSGTFIFEIAKSEIGYTEQRPAEYTACCLAAAIKEGWRGPVFLQGDHFQINAKKYVQDREAEIRDLKKLIKEAIDGGFLNIDIDASTVVDLTKPTVIEQQRPNFETTAILTDYIRENEPKGVTISVGGEIGEVGGKNSTEEELRAFMDGFLAALPKGKKGISKISIQTGTSHGGVVLPDGTIAKVKVDFDTIARLSKVAREAYHLSGVVQHGASTLPDDAFDLFTKNGASEVHLATGFQNIIYDNPAFPEDLKKDIYRHLADKHSDERKPADTEEQFIYKTRKKGFGPFKDKIWTLDEDRKKAIAAETEKKLDLYFRTLNARNTKDLVSKYVKGNP
ncbi:MAG: class II fructose-bisphosphate aldolase [Candidatus Methylomirabilis sp.]|nr:class II fructose-bisphosphate aldolase [Deltaproteobacteria bacterium]